MGNFWLPYMQEDADLYNANDSLIIYDKVNKGFVHILYYYDNSGDGNIETIKAGKTVLKNIPASYSNELLQSVENWFQSQDNWSYDFDCVTAVLSRGTDEQINQLVAFFDGQ